MPPTRTTKPERNAKPKAERDAKPGKKPSFRMEPLGVPKQQRKQYITEKPQMGLSQGLSSFALEQPASALDPAAASSRRRTTTSPSSSSTSSSSQQSALPTAVQRPPPYQQLAYDFSRVHQSWMFQQQYIAALQQRLQQIQQHQHQQSQPPPHQLPTPPEDFGPPHESPQDFPPSAAAERPTGPLFLDDADSNDNKDFSRTFDLDDQDVSPASEAFNNGITEMPTQPMVIDPVLLNADSQPVEQPVDNGLIDQSAYIDPRLLNAPTSQLADAPINDTSDSQLTVEPTASTSLPADDNIADQAAMTSEPHPELFVDAFNYDNIDGQAYAPAPETNYFGEALDLLNLQ